jgi:hypothetical protein
VISEVIGLNVGDVSFEIVSLMLTIWQSFKAYLINAPLVGHTAGSRLSCRVRIALELVPHLRGEENRTQLLN